MKTGVFPKIKEKVIHILSTELPAYFKYHSVEHTLYVLQAAETIAANEGISEENKFLLQVAVLYHDIGFIHTSENHEEEGCKIATKHLQLFGFSDDQISKVCGMIMATKLPQTPGSLIEEIIADADLEYLGTDRFSIISEKLFEEINLINNQISVQEWNEIQVKFLSNHHYFTSYCRQYKEPKKVLNMQNLKNNLME